jgi:tetratricopeptide (TPR) repeat protein
MGKQNNKWSDDLHRLLESQNFKTLEEAQKFMQSLIGKPIPSFPTEVLSTKEKAQDLIFEAYELSPVQGKLRAETALYLDIDCIEAYEYLASLEDTAEIAIIFFEKGVSVGRKLYGGAYLKAHKGMFWGLHETRAFMRCLQQYADCLTHLGQISQAAAILEEMLQLNPNDNQGVRYQLLLLLLQLDEHKKFLKYDKMFIEDNMTAILFTRALFVFKTEGENDRASEWLTKALKSNKHVAKKLLSPRPITELADAYTLGSEDEANFYASFAKDVWNSTKGAKDWLKKYAGKLK